MVSLRCQGRTYQALFNVRDFVSNAKQTWTPSAEAIPDIVVPQWTKNGVQLLLRRYKAQLMYVDFLEYQ